VFVFLINQFRLFRAEKFRVRFFSSVSLAFIHKLIVFNIQGTYVIMNSKFKFAIDRGGTFTDVYVKCPNGKERVLKLLSVDPANYSDAPTEGIRRILEEVSALNTTLFCIPAYVSHSSELACTLAQEIGEKIHPSQPIDGSKIEWIRMGTTVATNALLERKGERMALIINEGFRDLLFIGNQARPKIFDLVSVMVICQQDGTL